jgi:porin
VGLLVTYASVSSALAREQRLDLDAGLPVFGGATGVQGHSVILEANYNIHVGNGVDFAPDFQYYFRPNAQSNIKDAQHQGRSGVRLQVARELLTRQGYARPYSTSGT